MSNQIYKKEKKRNIKKIIRRSGLSLSIIGVLVGLYIFFPLLSWEFYLKPVFASSSYTSPIPKNTIITQDYLKNILASTADSISGVDYNNATNWVPSKYQNVSSEKSSSSYFISIPKLEIENAIVSTIDTDLEKHLVHFPGTAVPPEKGSAAIFGHSTLPQLFDRTNYKTIFANIHELSLRDKIMVNSGNNLYMYDIFAIEVTDPEDTSYLTQNYDSSYLYIITCTPPGTTWKRLVVKARLVKN